VIHRHRLTGIDADRVRGWREVASGSPVPVMVLCVGPYVRYEDLERWSGLFDLVVSEVIATDLLPGRISRLFAGAERPGPQPGVPAFRIEVAGGNESLCQALADALGEAGYQAEVIDDQVIGGLLRARNRSATLPDRVLTIWEIPVLEPGWADRLEWRASRTGPVIGLAGFADRAIVAQAKAAGAVACLDLPCDIDDLIDAVNRAVRTTELGTWPVPARAEPSHEMPPRPHARADRPEISAVPAPWPERGPLPRIPLS
jgi:CheY-like chemotaxis protein